MTTKLGIVVGIDKSPDNSKMYRVMVADVNKVSNMQYEWKFECKIYPEQYLISLLASGTRWLNITLDGKNIKGTTGSLSRFEDPNHKPYVIISQLVNKDNKILGYKIANYDGVVKNIPIKEMLAYGSRISKANLTPVQNAIFVPETADKKAHFKSYPNHNFISELLQTSKNKDAVQRKVSLKKNEKTLNKLEEIYSAEQLQQLRLGKEHGVDIRIYANPQLSAEQMKALREGLESHVNVKPIAHPEFKYKPMLYYIDCLQNNIDIRQFLNPKYDIGQLSELSLAVELGLDVSKLSNPKLKANEMQEIRERLEKNIWKDEFVKKDGTWI